jgi:formyltetrahydrofolate synthetase
MQVVVFFCEEWYLSLAEVCFVMIQADLGIAVQKACESATQPLKFLYPLDAGIKEKIEAIAKSYGASGVEYSEQVIL